MEEKIMNTASCSERTLMDYCPDIKIVDCTMRDGGLVNNFAFTDEFVKDLYRANIKAGVDYMEFGYKASKELFSPEEFGKWKFCNEEDIRAIVGENDSPLKISVMADVGRCDYQKDIISKKDSVKLSNSGTDKSDWKVVSAPDGNRIHQGRYLTEIMTDEETGEKTEFVTDKWTWLIDGQTGTLFHTAYTGAGVKAPTEADPDVFIIDTALEQTFNYFSISTRNTANALITKYRLSVSSDNVNYTEIISGDELPYKSAVATLTFPQVSGRYLKLEVMETTGKNFTIISELDAGISSSTQRILPSSSNLLFKTGGWINSNSVADEPNGYLIAENKNEKVVIRFIGESIAVYAAAGENYGTADVFVDGKKHSSINLDSHIQEARKLVINVENLENKEHTVEIITTSANKVMLNVIGIPYMASLVNAPNIYAERALAISLTVFVILFAALLAFVLVLLFVPKFRTLVFGNKFVRKLDERTPKDKKEKTAETDKVPEKPEKNVKTAKPAKKSAEPKAEPKTVKKAETPEKNVTPKKTTKKQDK